MDHMGETKNMGMFGLTFGRITFERRSFKRIIFGEITFKRMIFV